MSWGHLFGNRYLLRKKSGQPDRALAPVAYPQLGYALEARMMFDGAVVATVEPLITAQDTPQASTTETASHTTDSQSGTDQASGTQDAITADAMVAVAGDGVGSHKEVAFIDTSVADHQTLINQLPAGIELVLLDSSKDGLTQMAAWAQTHSGYQAMHIISHGAEARLYLGNATLDPASLAARQGELGALGASLTQDGDILLYGCSVASGEGVNFINAIASATGADVAASTDLTGSTAKGGDWTLEKQVGADGVQAVSLGFSHYNQLLDIVSFETDDFNNGTGSYTKTVSAVAFTFSGEDGYSYPNNFGSNYMIFPDSAAINNATKLSIAIAPGYTFDLTSFGYYTAQTDTITLTLTYANNTTVSGTLAATVNTETTLNNFSVFLDGSSNGLPISANDVIKVEIATANSTGNFDFGTNSFNISDVKAISSTNSTSTVSAGPSNEASTFSTSATSVGSATPLLDFTIGDPGSGDGVATNISALYANVSGSASTAELSQMRFLLSGPDANNVLGSYDSSTGRVTFSGLNLSIADGGSETYTIKAYYNDNTSSSDITDHHTVVLSLNAANLTTVAGGSTFVSSQANVTNGSGASIDVAATKLIYSQAPSSTVVSGINFTSQPQLIAVDDNGNIDIDFSGLVTLSENGSGSLGGTTSVNASAGHANFSGIKYTSASDADANFVLTAASGILGSATSASIDPDVVATKLVFATQPLPTTIQDGQSASFTTVPVVQAVDANGMLDQGYSTNIVLAVTDPNDGTLDGTVNSLTVTSGDQDASGTTVTLTPAGGIASYTGLILHYTNSGATNTLALRASSGSLTAVNSGAIASTSNSVPVFSNITGGAFYTENGSPVVIDSDVSVADTELDALNGGLGNYQGASLTIVRQGAANSQDLFGHSGLLGPLVQGQDFSYNGIVVGTVTTNSSGTLILTFNSDASSARVDGVLQSLTYANSSDDPPTLIMLNWTFNDGSLSTIGSNQALQGINRINDAPVISNTTVSKTVNEDSAQTFSASDFGFSDVDSGDTLQSITIVTAPTAGELFIDANSDGVRDVGDTLLGVGSLVSAANIGKLTFRPAADANGAGYSTFTWMVSDGTALSANVGTMTLNVTAVNDAPVISNTTVSKTVNEDSAQTFSASDFGFSDVDSGDTLHSITIVQALTTDELFIDDNGDGVRGLGDTIISDGSLVSADEVEKLVFRPAANANGAGYSTFTWTVSDGTASSANHGTMTLNVTVVNDAPTLSNGITIPLTTMTEDAAPSATLVSSLLSNAGYADHDNGAASGIAITSAVGNGGWQYSTDSGANWFNMGTVSGSSALLLASTAQIRYAPDNANGETATLAFKAWDQTSGTATTGASKGLMDTSTSGGSSDLSLNSAQVSLAVTSVNDAPTVGSSVSPQSTAKDSLFSFTVPVGTFVDMDSSDTLTLSATLADGSALPGWLSFDPATRTFSGTPAGGDVGNLSIRLTATDSSNASVSTTFGLNVTNVNGAPVVSGAVDSQTVAQNSSINFTIPAGIFTDPDSGDTLTLTATQGDGSALPGWLSFDPATRTFSGTPASGDVGNLSILITATDSDNASVSTRFEVVVTRSPVDNGDPEFKVNGGSSVQSDMPRPLVSVTQNAPVTLGALFSPPSLGALNVGGVTDNATAAATIFQGAQRTPQAGNAVVSQIADAFVQGSVSGSASVFESSLGSFPSFNTGGTLGGSSSLAGMFSGIALPSLSPLAVFSGGSWRDVNTSGGNTTGITSPSEVAMQFAPDLVGQLLHIDDNAQQRLTSLEQALRDISQIASVRQQG